MEDILAASTCSYMSIVILHYALVFLYTQNWTIWIVFMYTVSIALFAPIFILVYNEVPNTHMTHRLGEILTESWIFWALVALTVVMCIMPALIVHYFKRLCYPSFKDLIIQHRKSFKI